LGHLGINSSITDTEPGAVLKELSQDIQSSDFLASVCNSVGHFYWTKGNLEFKQLGCHFEISSLFFDRFRSPYLSLETLYVFSEKQFINLHFLVSQGSGRCVIYKEQLHWMPNEMIKQ
jgi:hypothetical protein